MSPDSGAVAGTTCTHIRSPFILAGHAPRRAADTGLVGINVSDASDDLLTKTLEEGSINIVAETIDDKVGVGIDRKVYDELISLASR